MVSIFPLLAASLFLAYLSQNEVLTYHSPDWGKYDIALFLMIVILSFYCGLRTSYNDTGTYISGFNNAVTWQEYWSTSHNILGNIGYYAFQSFFHQYISDNYHLFFTVIAFFITGTYVRFIRRYSENFVFSILLFFCISLYIAQFAAMKQHIANAFLVLALPYLKKKQYLRYYILVFIAMLFHSYALLFAIMPLFLNRPWTKITYITIAIVIFVLLTFEGTITSFLEYAETFGKEIVESEVFDTEGINPFRLSVYAVLPAISFCFQGRLKHEYTKEEAMLTNMSILSFLVMSLGIYSGANLFARCAIYFEIGTITVFPWIINRVFARRTASLVYSVASVFYLLFFYLDIQSFASEYARITISEFILGLLN